MCGAERRILMRIARPPSRRATATRPRIHVSDPVAGRERPAPELDEVPSVELDVDVGVVVVVAGVVVVVGDTAVVDVPDDDELVPEEVLPLSPLPGRKAL